MLYYIDENWYHFINEYLERISKFASQEVPRPESGDETVMFWTFYSPADTLWLPKIVVQVLGYTTEETFWWLLLHFSFIDFYWFLPPI